MTSAPISRQHQQRFEQLFARSQHHAYNLALHLTGNHAEAEDVTQDAYVRAWQHFDRFDASRSFESWLFRIITNRAIDLKRRQKRIPMYALDTPLQEPSGAPLTFEVADPESDPEQIVLERMGEEQLQKSLEALPEIYRQVMRLCAVEERSCPEIAETMQCAVGTVRSRMYRARRLLRQRIE